MSPSPTKSPRREPGDSGLRAFQVLPAGYLKSVSFKAGSVATAAEAFSTLEVSNWA